MIASRPAVKAGPCGEIKQNELTASRANAAPGNHQGGATNDEEAKSAVFLSFYG